MKAERRHELHHNQLADWLGQLLAQAEKYGQAIAATLVGLAILGGAYAYWTGRTARQEEAAWARFMAGSDASTAGGEEQLTDLANQRPKTAGGQWARLTLADNQLRRGLDQMFENRTTATLTLTSAVEHYTKLRSATTDPARLERAAYGLGQAYEALNKLNEARDEYRGLLKRFPSGIYAAPARARLDDLDREDTRQFYDWFARQDIKPPADPAAPFTPPAGKKPEFDLNSLPADAPIFEATNPLKDSKAASSKPDQPTAESKSGDSSKPVDATPPADSTKPAESTKAPPATTDAKSIAAPPSPSQPASDATPTQPK